MDRGLVRRLFSVSLPRGHCLIQHFVKFKQKSVEFHWVALDCDLGGQCQQAFSLFLLHRELSDRRRITFTTSHKSSSRVLFDRAGRDWWEPDCRGCRECASLTCLPQIVNCGRTDSPGRRTS